MCNQGSSTQMGDPDTLPASAVEKVSCIPHFDALWFCYCEDNAAADCTASAAHV